MWRTDGEQSGRRLKSVLRKKNFGGNNEQHSSHETVTFKDQGMSLDLSAETHNSCRCCGKINHLDELEYESFAIMMRCLIEFDLESNKPTVRHHSSSKQDI